jgi:hypothetical protein
MTVRLMLLRVIRGINTPTTLASTPNRILLHVSYQIVHYSSLSSNFFTRNPYASRPFKYRFAAFLDMNAG